MVTSQKASWTSKIIIKGDEEPVVLESTDCGDPNTVQLLHGKGFEITQRFVLDHESLDVLVNRCDHQSGGAFLRTEAPSACAYFRGRDMAGVCFDLNSMLVTHFVPAQLLGEDVKSKLHLSTHSPHCLAVLVNKITSLSHSGRTKPAQTSRPMTAANSRKAQPPLSNVTPRATVVERTPQPPSVPPRPRTARPQSPNSSEATVTPASRPAHTIKSTTEVRQSPKVRSQKEPNPSEATGWEAGWEDDDCGGNLKEAERKLFARVLAYLKRSNMKQLFKEMDKEGSGDLDFTEFRYGMRFIVRSGMSDLMLKKVFDGMDKGSDHLGTMTFSDSSLAYQEFQEKVLYYREESRRNTFTKAKQMKQRKCTKKVDEWLKDYATKGHKFGAAPRTAQVRELEAHWESKKPFMRALTKKRPLPKGHKWLEEDFGGSVKQAERCLFKKLLMFAQGRSIPTLFRRMNGNGDGRLELDEWLKGCRELVDAKQSDWMLTEMFELMDGCDDPACEYAEPDNCLSYAELHAKLTYWHNKLKTETGLQQHRSRTGWTPRDPRLNSIYRNSANPESHAPQILTPRVPHTARSRPTSASTDRRKSPVSRPTSGSSTARTGSPTSGLLDLPLSSEYTKTVVHRQLFGRDALEPTDAELYNSEEF